MTRVDLVIRIGLTAFFYLMGLDEDREPVERDHTDPLARRDRRGSRDAARSPELRTDPDVGVLHEAIVRDSDLAQDLPRRTSISGEIGRTREGKHQNILRDPEREDQARRPGGEPTPLSNEEQYAPDDGELGQLESRIPKHETERHGWALPFGSIRDHLPVPKPGQEKSKVTSADCSPKRRPGSLRLWLWLWLSQRERLLITRRA